MPKYLTSSFRNTASAVSIHSLSLSQSDGGLRVFLSRSTRLRSPTSIWFILQFIFIFTEVLLFLFFILCQRSFHFAPNSFTGRWPWLSYLPSVDFSSIIRLIDTIFFFLGMIVCHEFFSVLFWHLKFICFVFREKD